MFIYFLTNILIKKIILNKLKIKEAKFFFVKNDFLNIIILS